MVHWVVPFLTCGETGLTKSPGWHIWSAYPQTFGVFFLTAGMDRQSGQKSRWPPTVEHRWRNRPSIFEVDPHKLVTFTLNKRLNHESCTLEGRWKMLQHKMQYHVSSKNPTKQTWIDNCIKSQTSWIHRCCAKHPAWAVWGTWVPVSSAWAKLQLQSGVGEICSNSSQWEEPLDDN